jgi:hypothetical protein
MIYRPKKSHQVVTWTNIFRNIVCQLKLMGVMEYS